MAENPYPIPRQLRRSGILVGNGGDTYGPFDFGIFDPEDVAVYARSASDLRFSKVDGMTVTKVNGNSALNPLDKFSIRFPANVPATTRFIVFSSRLAVRAAGVLSGTKINPDALEKEFSKIATQQQELRRDIGRAIMVEFGEEALVLDAGLEDGDTLMKQGSRLAPGPNLPDLASSLIAEATTQATRSRTEADRSEAASRLSVDASQTAIAQASAAIAAAEASGDVAFFDTKAAAVAALGALPANKVVRIFTDETKSDAGTFYRVEAGALVFKQYVETFQPELAGTPRRPYVQRMVDFISALDAMASGGLGKAVRNSEATAADASEITAAINNAVDYLYGAGGGALHYPRGLFFVNHGLNIGGAQVAVQLRSKVRHAGESVGGTVFSLADGSNSHVFSGLSPIDAAIENMTIECNGSNQAVPGAPGSAPQGINLTGTLERLSLHNLRVLNSYDYGIGLQANSLRNADIENIYIENAGADGFDYKNVDMNSRGARMRGVTVRGFGSQLTGEIFAGVDLRGPVMASQIRVEELGKVIDTGRTGIRLLGGAGANGGARRTILSDFFVEGYDATAQQDPSVIGLWVRDRNCSASGGYITKAGFGVMVAQREALLNNITAEECRRGFSARATETDGGNPLYTLPEDVTVSGLVARGCTEIGVRIEAGVKRMTFVGLVAVNNGVNVSLAGGSEDIKFIGGTVRNATGGTNVNNGGTRTVFSNISGYKVAGAFESSSFPLDAVGVYTLTIPHDLAITPSAQKITLTLVVDGSADDFETVGPYLRVPGTIGVSCKVKVKVASATAGLTGRVLMTVAE